MRSFGIERSVSPEDIRAVPHRLLHGLTAPVSPSRVFHTGAGMLSVRPVLVMGVIGLFAPSVVAQSSDVPTSPTADTIESASRRSSLPASWNRVSVWVGGAGSNGALIGKMPRSTIGAVGVRYHHRLAPAPGAPPDGLTYTYTIDVLPVVLLSVPPAVVPRSAVGRRVTVGDGVITYGVGAAPIGLRLNYRVAEPVQPYIAGSTGVLYFVDPWPDERGRRLNFTVEAGTGLQIGVTATTTLTVGYRYYHLSNGFRGEINPGIDAHFFHAGITVVP